jgi:carboxylesterase type B
MKFQALAILASCQLALTATTISKPFEESLRKRQATNSSAFPLQVDLGYSIYEGVNNATSGINLWSGIRFAAPPIGALRWQAPQPPTFNRSAVIQANETPNQCPQSYPNIGNQAEAVELINTLGGSEDCLFLNVFAPENAQNLPVLVWIHGGGYGFGNGREDLTDIIATNNNSFIGVTIQYRLGAFGFLSSDEVNRFGVVNAGIRDQTFALQWVQSYIHLFGGNASAVTISGESAGGGSVMLQSMAYGGTLGQSLFTNVSCHKLRVEREN